jgi:hypothetical protein
MSKMTPWFPPHIKPARKGVYQITYTGVGWGESQDPLYATWNGLRWSSASWKKRDGYHTRFLDAVQNKCWRGFTEKQT